MVNPTPTTFPNMIAPQKKVQGHTMNSEQTVPVEFKIEQSHDNYISVDIELVPDIGYTLIEVGDYSGPLGDPAQTARIYLNHDEAKQIRDYLNTVYPPTMSDPAQRPVE